MSRGRICVVAWLLVASACSDDGATNSDASERTSGPGLMADAARSTTQMDASANAAAMEGGTGDAQFDGGRTSVDSGAHDTDSAVDSGVDAQSVFDAGHDAGTPAPICTVSCDDAIDCTEDVCFTNSCSSFIDSSMCPPGEACDVRGTGCTSTSPCGSTPDCADTDPCTRNERCNMATASCEWDILDNDADGHAPISCGGDDFDDANARKYPGVPDACDGYDNDGDGMVDEAPEANASCVGGTCPGCSIGCRGASDIALLHSNVATFFGDMNALDYIQSCSRPSGSGLSCSGLTGLGFSAGCETCTEILAGCAAKSCGSCRLDDLTMQAACYACLCTAGCAQAFERCSGLDHPAACGGPLTLVVEEGKKIVLTDGTASDRFGEAVAISGDVLVVGASGRDDIASNAGATYVFTRGGGVWSSPLKLTASDGAASGSFGRSVAISGDTLVVGASEAAYVFVRVGMIWTEQQKLTASDGAAGDGFGGSVSISGDTVIVGASMDDDVGTDSGSAYVFLRTVTTWADQQKLTAGDGAAGDRFGQSVAISGDTVVVGAYLDSHYVGPYFATTTGAAYGFARSGSAWTQAPTFYTNDVAANNAFARSVAVSGSTALAGAAGYGSNDTGSAYVFTTGGSTWIQRASLTSDDPAPGDKVGTAVSLSETADIALVGASGDDANANDSGAAYMFVKNGSAWPLQRKLTASDGKRGDLFGSAVSISGTTAVIGASGDGGQGLGSGSIYLFDL